MSMFGHLGPHPAGARHKQLCTFRCTCTSAMCKMAAIQVQDVRTVECDHNYFVMVLCRRKRLLCKNNNNKINFK